MRRKKQKKEEKLEREKEIKREKFNERRERNLIKYIFFILVSCSGAHLFMDVHCSKKPKKSRYASTTAACILVFWWN